MITPALDPDIPFGFSRPEAFPSSAELGSHVGSRRLDEDLIDPTAFPMWGQFESTKESSGINNKKRQTAKIENLDEVTAPTLSPPESYLKPPKSVQSEDNLTSKVVQKWPYRNSRPRSSAPFTIPLQKNGQTDLGLATSDTKIMPKKLTLQSSKDTKPKLKLDSRTRNTNSAQSVSDKSLNVVEKNPFRHEAASTMPPRIQPLEKKPRISLKTKDQIKKRGPSQQHLPLLNNFRPEIVDIFSAQRNKLKGGTKDDRKSAAATSDSRDSLTPQAFPARTTNLRQNGQAFRKSVSGPTSIMHSNVCTILTFFS